MSHSPSMSSVSLRTWRARLMGSALTVLVAAPQLLQAQPATASQIASPTPLAPVVGAWRAVGTGAMPAVLTVDGTLWSGSTPADAAQRAGVRLFGAASPAWVANVTAPGAFPLAVAEGVQAFGEGTLRVRFRMDGGASDQNAGIVFGLAADGTYWYARYNTKDGNLALWRFANGERQRVADGTGHRQLPLGAWHELVVRVAGRQVTAAITGDRTMTLAHTLEAPPAGRVGVWVKRDAVTSFRDFVAEPAGR